jgi:chromosome segregation ATPase
VSHDLAETTVAEAVQAPKPPSGGAGQDSFGRTGGELERQIDALSLNQALLDFELANARVLDLTARLVEANSRVMRHQSETDALRAELDGFQSRLDAAEDTAKTAVTTSAQTTEAAQAETAAARSEVLAAQAERDAAKAQTAIVAAELAATHNSRTFRAAGKLKALPGVSGASRLFRFASRARR